MLKPTHVRCTQGCSETYGLFREGEIYRILECEASLLEDVNVLHLVENFAGGSDFIYRGEISRKENRAPQAYGPMFRYLHPSVKIEEEGE